MHLLWSFEDKRRIINCFLYVLACYFSFLKIKYNSEDTDNKSLGNIRCTSKIFFS